MLSDVLLEVAFVRFVNYRSVNVKSNSWKRENAVFLVYIVRFSHISHGLKGAFVEIACVLEEYGIVKDKALEVTPFFNYTGDNLPLIMAELQGRQHVGVDEVVDVGSEDA